MTLSNSSNNTAVIKRIALVLLIVLNVSIVYSASAQYKEVRRLGTSQAICSKPGVQTAAELQAFFADNPALINSILEDANWQGDRQQLFDAIATGNFTSVAIPVGTTFEWMAMKTKGVAGAEPNRVWAGEQSFDAFTVNISKSCVNHQLVIPKVCCNLSLASTTRVTEEPLLTLSVDDNALTICSEPGTSVILSTPNGISEELNLDKQSCWQADNLNTGTYTAQAIAECGTTSESVVIAAMKAADVDRSPKSADLVPFIAGVIGSETLMRYEASWDMEMRDTSAIFGVRGGFKLPISQSISLVPTLGLVHRTGINGGNTYPDEGFTLDLGIEKYINDHLFIGAGIGAWDVDDSDYREPSLFINVGGMISPKTEWFLEARGIDSDNPDGNDDFSDNHAYNAGIRYLFK